MFVEALAIADIDGNGKAEIVGNLAPDSLIVLEYDPFPPTVIRKWARSVLSPAAAPILADVNWDGPMEVILPGNDEWIHVWWATGITYPLDDEEETDGRFCRNPEGIGWNLRSLAVGEVSGGTRGLNIVQSVRGEGSRTPQVVLFQTGWGWDPPPCHIWEIGINTDSEWLSTPVIGDVDGEGLFEVIVARGSKEEYLGGELEITVPGGIWVLSWDPHERVSDNFRFLTQGGQPAAVAVSVPHRTIFAGGGKYGHKNDGQYPWAKIIRAHAWKVTADTMSADDNLPIPGRKFFDTHTWTQPVVADFDGDGNLEVLISTNASCLACFEYDDASGLSVERGWPQMFPDIPLSPTVADLDDDDCPAGENMELVVQDRSGLIHVFRLGGCANDHYLPWPEYGHDPCNTFCEQTIRNLGRGRDEGPSQAGAPGRELDLRVEPSPSRQLVGITFSLGSAQHARLEIFDIEGRRTRLLADGDFPPGDHDIPWDGRTDGGEAVSAGVYFARLSCGEREEVRRISVIR
jgi:hypothetical protein